MINSKKDLLYYLNKDKHALGYKSQNRPKLFRDEIWKYQIKLRKLEYYCNCKKDPISRVYILLLKLQFRRLSNKYNFYIPRNVFGAGLAIAHIGPIIVNPSAKIGENCRIHVGVNIGTQAGEIGNAPIIGNNVYIGPGAKMFGKITIGNNVAIGANSVVNKNFEDNVTIAGIPAKVISKKGTKDILKDVI